MGKIIGALIGLVLVFLLFGFLGHRNLPSDFAEECVAASQLSQEACTCIGEAMQSETSFIAFAGIGGFRPLMNEQELMSIANRASQTCTTEG